ncbi:MAG: ACT domain-containing protein, partial [Chloroflexota bacterium]
NLEKLSRHLEFNKVDDFFAAIGCNDISITRVISKINDLEEVEKPKSEDTWEEISTQSLPTTTTSPNGMQIQGVGNLLTNLARCCRPVPGDQAIIGYITRGHGVTIHRRDCSNILRLEGERQERLIEVNWHIDINETYPVDVRIEAFDRPGLLHDITAIVANDRINLSSVSVDTKNSRKRKNKAIVFATFEIMNIDQLSRVLARIEQLPNVINAQRRK